MWKKLQLRLCVLGCPRGRSAEADSFPLPFIDTLPAPGMRHPLQVSAKEKVGNKPTGASGGERGERKAWLLSLTDLQPWANHVPLRT